VKAKANELRESDEMMWRMKREREREREREDEEEIEKVGGEQLTFKCEDDENVKIVLYETRS
jgi:hypothetical protein